MDGNKLPGCLAAFVGFAWGLLALLFLGAVQGALAPAHAEKVEAELPGWIAWAAVLCLGLPSIVCMLRPSCAAGIFCGAMLGLAIALVGMVGLWLMDKDLGRGEAACWLGLVVVFGGIGGLGGMFDLRS